MLKKVRARTLIWDSAAQVERMPGDEFEVDVDVVSPVLFDHGYIELVVPLTKKEKEALEKQLAEEHAAAEAALKEGQTQGP